MENDFLNSPFLKGFLVLVALIALVLGFRLFFKMPELVGGSVPKKTTAQTGTGPVSAGSVNDVYIPQKDPSKRAPIHFNTHVK